MVRGVDSGYGAQYPQSLPPTPAQIEAINYLWFATYAFTHIGSAHIDDFNLQMAANSIAYFLKRFTSIPPCTADAATINIFKEVTGGTVNPPAAGSLADLAAKYQSAVSSGQGYNQAHMDFETALGKSDVAVDAHNWFGAEGFKDSGLTPNPQNLSEKDVQALLTVIQNYDGSPAALTQIMNAVSKINADLQSSAPPLDAYSQMMSDLINTPTSDENPQSSLVALIATPDAFANAITHLHDNGNEMITALEQMMKNEWPSP